MSGLNSTYDQIERARRMRAKPIESHPHSTCADCGGRFLTRETFTAIDPRKDGAVKARSRICRECYFGHGWSAAESMRDWNRGVYAARNLNIANLRPIPAITLADGTVLNG